MIKKIEVVGAVIVRDGLVLCVQRGRDGELPDLWEFPGGKIEPGETRGAALSREIREELLAEVCVGEHIVTTVHQYPFAEVTLSTFYCVLLSSGVTLTEHQAMAWLLPSELKTLEWAPADVPTVERLPELFDSLSNTTVSGGADS